MKSLLDDFVTFAALIPALLIGPLGRAHPLHTSITQITYQPATRSARAVIRIFEDDLRTALPELGSDEQSNALVVAYIGKRFTITGQHGREARLTTCGVEQKGGLLWICLDATLPQGLKGVLIQNSILFEAFDDQVNVVQLRQDRLRQSLIFNKGARPKRVG